jgi:hypothetical protein
MNDDKVVDFGKRLRAAEHAAVKDVLNKEYELAKLIAAELVGNPAAVKDWDIDNVLRTLAKAVVMCAAMDKVSA